MIRNDSPRKGLRGSTEALTQVRAGVFERTEDKGQSEAGGVEGNGVGQPQKRRFLCTMARSLGLIAMQ